MTTAEDARLARAARFFGKARARVWVDSPIVGTPYHAYMQERVGGAVPLACTRLDRRLWAEQRAARVGGHVGPGRAPVTLDDVLAEPAMERYPVEQALDDGSVLSGTTVNAVNAAQITGARVHLPWAEPTATGEGALPGMATQRALLGIASAHRATGNQSFWMRYATPVCSRHTLHLSLMKINETASRNDLLSNFAQQLTIVLLQTGLGGHTQLSAHRTGSHNRVFVFRLPRPMDCELLRRLFPGMTTREGMAEGAAGTTMRDPAMEGLCLLVFARCLVLMGAKNVDGMHMAMGRFMPRIAAAMSAAPSLKRPIRPHEAEEEEERPTKRANLALI